MINFRKLIFTFFLLLITVGIIFYQFPDLPKRLAVDEVEFAKLALSLDGKAYVPYSSMATGHSTLYFYVILGFLKLFGITAFALRLPSALSGIACGLLFFAIAKMIFKNDFLAFVSSLVLITSRWFVNFSRFAFEPVFLLFLELSSIYFFFNYLNNRSKIKNVLLSGICAGLAYNSYTPGRIFFLLPLGFLALKIIKQHNHIAMKQLLYFLIPFIILIIPLQSYLFTHEDTRVKQLLFFANEELTLQTKLGFVAENIKKTTSMFFVQGDPNGKHNYPYKPALNPILGILFITGLIVSLRNVKKNLYSLFFLFYSLFSLLPTLLVYPWENPSMLRAYTILPAIAYFVSLPFAIFKKNKFIIGILMLLFIFSSVYELRTYFKYQRLVSVHAFEVNVPLKRAVTCTNIFDCEP